MNTLQTELTRFLETGQSNPAMTMLLNDYIREHLFVAVLGGAFAVFLLGTSLYFLIHFFQSRPMQDRWWTFAKKTHLSFGLLSGVVGLFMALIAVVNTMTTLNPTQGFSQVANSTRISGEVRQALLEWIESGSHEIPAIIEQRVSSRIEWQQPKAVVSWMLLVVLGVASLRIWQGLIAQSRQGIGRFTPGFGLIGGVCTTAACYLLMVMAVANTATCFAPLAISVFGAGG